MKSILLVLFMIVSLSLSAQNTYVQSTDAKNGSVVYKGAIRFGDLLWEDDFKWLEKGAEKYKPNKKALKYLAGHLHNYKMVVFLGTWCIDSKEMIPELYKVLQLTNYPMEQYLMFGTDREKTTLNSEHLLYNITNVPTVILFKGYSEIGRIVESTDKSIERDLVNTIMKDAAKP
jgi:thiol-disulfide isomerase/thioredoxin